MARLHGSAVVDSEAHLADDVVVGPLCVIEADVTVGSGTVLLPGTVLLDGARVGSRCRLGPYATVGGLPMDRDFRGEPSTAVLEDGVELRDFASVHRATGEGAATVIGAGTMVMNYAHVTHNVTVGRHVVLTTQVQLGGHARIGDRAVLGAGAMVHQFARVGELAMVGAAGGVRKDVLPFLLAADFPVRHYGLNRVGLRRNGLDADVVRALGVAVRALRRRDQKALSALDDSVPEVARLLAYAADSRRGVAPFAR
ncbi:MAG: acyl-ACP--UDP-N-acetylglucosamine O-acyltransferase [Trueperaceae bacterium]